MRGHHFVSHKVHTSSKPEDPLPRRVLDRRGQETKRTSTWHSKSWRFGSVFHVSQNNSCEGKEQINGEVLQSKAAIEANKKKQTQTQTPKSAAKKAAAVEAPKKAGAKLSEEEAKERPAGMILRPMSLREPCSIKLSRGTSKLPLQRFTPPAGDASQRSETTAIEGAPIVLQRPDWTPEKGGLLVDAEGGAGNAKAVVPEFNSLIAFLVPREHWVSEMAPGAPPRFSLFGWLHDLEPYGDELKPLGESSRAMLEQKAGHLLHSWAQGNPVAKSRELR
eukprot:s1457_g3.t1